MKKWFGLILGIAGLAVLVPSSRAQAVYAATRGTQIQAGVGVLFLNPDYVNREIKGASFWGDYDIRRYLGAEVAVHIGSFITPDDIAENSYLVGPRFIYHYRKFAPYAKALLGRSTITNQDNNQSSSYNTYAFGGGLDYRVARKFNVRADFIQEVWPNFEPNTLSPTAFSVGVLYIIR